MGTSQTGGGQLGHVITISLGSWRSYGRCRDELFDWIAVDIKEVPLKREGFDEEEEDPKTASRPS